MNAANVLGIHCEPEHTAQSIKGSASGSLSSYTLPFLLSSISISAHGLRTTPKGFNMQLLSTVGHRLQTLHQDQLRADLSNELNIPAFLAEIDRRPGLTGAGAIYFDGSDVLVIRTFKPVCQINPIYVVIRSAPRAQVSNIKPTNPSLERENVLMYSVLREASSTGIACAAGIISWAAVFGSAAASVPSIGSSGAITVLAFSAALASTAQCFNGVARTSAVVLGYENNLAWFDSQSWYTQTMTALDVVSLAGGGAALVGIAKTTAALKASGNASVLEALKGMSRHERKRLTETLIHRMHPGISNAALKAYIRAGVYPARYSSVEISRTIKLELANAVSAALSFGGSATAGIIRNPARLRDLVFGLYTPVQTL